MIDRRQFVAAAAATAAVPARAAAPGSVVTSRIVVEARRVWVPATIGGRGPFPFIIDTGASVSGIAPALVKELGLHGIGNKLLGGIGGVRDFDFYEARNVVYGGGIEQDSVAFASFDLPLGGAGLLAAGLVTTRDSDLDFATGQWRVWPDGRPAFDGLTRLDGYIDPGGRGSAKLVVEAVLDGRKLRLLVDTGAQTEVLLFPRAAKQSGLWDDARPFAPTRLRGIGGAEAKLGRTVRAGRLNLGDFAFERPLIKMYDPRDYNTAAHDGLLGLDVIERLNWSTEVKKAKLWVRTNGRPKPPEVYGRAGLWLERAPDGTATVIAVSTGSPASDAGVKVGDRLAPGADWAGTLRALSADNGRTAEVPFAGGPKTLALRAFL